MLIAMAPQLLCIAFLTLFMGLNRLGWSDPRLPLAGIFLAMLAWCILALYRVSLDAYSVFHHPALSAPLLRIFISTVPLLLVAAFFIKAQQVPRIHDITTDRETPPQYNLVTQLRHPAHNPTQYQTTNRDLQVRAYSDITPLEVLIPVESMQKVIMSVIEQRGWTIHGGGFRGDTLEASATTPILGFVDDIVIRVQAMGQGSRVDIRSASRIGMSDLGANAQRIRQLLDDIQAGVGGE